LEQLITIDIFGQRYTFRADEHMIDPQSVADFLVAEVRKIETGQAEHIAETNRFVMLLQAALNISSQHLKMRQQLTAVSDRLYKKTERLQGTLHSSAVFPQGSGAIAS
jgi:cell division protein ZapA (FtsZ GTPase activity inhibitor)